MRRLARRRCVLVVARSSARSLYVSRRARRGSSGSATRCTTPRSCASAPAREGIDPALLAAVIYQESKFRPDGALVVGRDRADAAHAVDREGDRAPHRRHGVPRQRPHRPGDQHPLRHLVPARPLRQVRLGAARARRLQRRPGERRPLARRRARGSSSRRRARTSTRVEHLEHVYRRRLALAALPGAARRRRPPTADLRDARLGEGGLRDPGDGRAGRGRATGPVKAERIAQAQEIPIKFLENIMSDLRNAGLVRSQRGVEGGYWLARPAARDHARAGDPRRRRPARERARRTARRRSRTTARAEPLRDVWVAVRASLRARARGGHARRRRPRRAARRRRWR